MKKKVRKVAIKKLDKACDLDGWVQIEKGGGGKDILSQISTSLLFSPPLSCL